VNFLLVIVYVIVNTYGIHCEYPYKVYGAPCLASTCTNGGFCDPQDKRCVCKQGFTGDFCEFKTNNFLCTNNDDCSFGGYRVGVCELSTGHCICTGNTYGVRCEVPTTIGIKCISDIQCNGGICGTQSNRCICPTGLTGAYCTVQTNGFLCLNNDHCKNGGVCERSTGHCICSEKWTGIACDVPAS